MKSGPLSSRGCPGATARVLIVLVAGVLGLASALPAASRAQVSVTGRVLDGSTGRPVVNARASLRRGGGVVASTATDREGRFNLEASGAESLLVEAMGMTERTISLGEAVGSVIDLGDIVLAPVPILLDGIEAEGESVCGVPGERLREGLERLEAARPQFAAITENDRLPAYRYVMEMVRTARKARPVGPAIDWLPDTTLVQLEASLASGDPSLLSSAGFARALGDSTTIYLLPTPSWFTSDAFPTDYCVSALQAEEGHGLRFWPKRDGRSVGIRGAVWLEDDGAPASVEFNYTSLHAFVDLHEVPRLVREFEPSDGYIQGALRKFELDEADFGGRLTFSEVSPGTRMTIDWEVRGVYLSRFALWRMGDLQEFRPRPRPLITSAQLKALVPVGRR